jgi:phage shock protein A
VELPGSTTTAPADAIYEFTQQLDLVRASYSALIANSRGTRRTFDRGLERQRVLRESTNAALTNRQRHRHPGALARERP